MPRVLRLAILCSFLVHGVLILLARYRTSYDAYVHMFFGDHYRTDWWSLWDPRWYTGLYVSSYPPLVHQLIGLLSHMLGLDAAFALVLWITLALLPLSVFAFARIFAGRSAAAYAALGAALLPSVYLTAHIFGQLPTLAATVTALFGTAALARYLRSGDRLNGALAVSALGTTMAFHHATLLFLPWLVFAVTLHTLLKDQTQWKLVAVRLLIFGILSALAILLVIWPFWEWGRTQTIQTPIDHASRHNFFGDPLAALIFFLPVYGPLMLLIPCVPPISRQRRWFGLGFLFLILFLLGLGGTTPLPRWLFGSGWEWLTYDRFAFWASLCLLPFLGIMVTVLRRRYARNMPARLFSSLAITSILVGLVTSVLPLQPGAVDMKQIVDFLEKEDRSHWRYLTFGFGDQLAFLSTQTSATTIDGSYHTARTLPELRSSGLGQIDTAFWLKDGLSALDPILQKAGQHGVRWGFVNVPQYIPVLERNGWTHLATLESAVQVWENPRAVLASPPSPPSGNPLASFSWGTLPILSLFTTLALGSLSIWHLKAEKALRTLQALLVGLIPISLGFWYYRTLGEFPYDRVYFTYNHALIFLGDALALLVIVLWLILSLRGRVGRAGGVRSVALRPGPRSAGAVPWRHNPRIYIENALSKFTRHSASSILAMTSFLFLLSSLSTLWSAGWRTSLYISLHFWLIFLLVLVLRERHELWRPLMLGFCVALATQVIAGFIGFASQSTAFLAPLGMTWPGSLDPSMRGASVVQLPDGLRFLRAYGTLPHPNLLGGFAFISLLGPVGLLFSKEKPNPVAPVLFGLGVMLLGLTFSRSAWLALIAFLLFLTLKSRYLNLAHLRLLIMASILTAALTLYPLRELVFTRLGNAPVATEQLSTFGRSWLAEQALGMIFRYPLTGVGVGSYLLELADYAIEGAGIEPVHNIFLLAGAELGIPGMLLMIAFAVSLAYYLFRVQSPRAILAGGTLTGLGVISLFDHYLWTLAPGRLMLALALGLWVGQTFRDDA